MTDKQNTEEPMFYQLVLSLQAASMQHLGKVMSPLSGELERNLEAAKHSIDLLEMVQRKTDGNLTEDEKKLLDHVLYELRLNYVDEVNKPTEDSKPEETSSEAAEKSGEEAGEGAEEGS